MQQHRKTIRAARSDSVSGEQQRRAGGGVNRVVDQMTRAEQFRGNWRRLACLHAERRAVDDEVGLRKMRGIGAFADGQIFSGKKCAEFRDERPEFFQRPIHEHDARTFLKRTLHRDRPPSTATRAQHHHTQIAQLRAEFRAHRAYESGAVRVVTGQLVPLDHHRVHHADPARVLIGAIDQRERGEFVRDGAIHADETLARQQTKRLRQLLRADMQPRIARSDPAFRQRRIVHRRRRGMRHGVAEDREPQRRLLHRPRAQILDRINFLHPANVAAARSIRACTRSRPSTSSM